MLAYSPLTVAGGWTSAGGGSGVVCFINSNIAEKVDQALEKGRSLDKNWLEAITQVEPLDLFEATEAVKKGIVDNWATAPSSPHSWPELHAQVVSRIKMLSPLFGLSLEIQKKNLNQKKWLAKDFLPLQFDQFHPGDKLQSELQEKIKSEHPACRLVQIMKRLSANPLQRKANQLEDHLIPEHFWDFELQYVPHFFEKMSPLGQTLLILHEQLYLMGQALGHSSSEYTRFWVREFALLRRENIYATSEQWFISGPNAAFSAPVGAKTLDNYPRPPAWIRARMTRTFGDYALFYLKEFPSHRLAANPTFTAYIDMLRKARHFMGTCLPKDHFDDIEYKQHCFDRLFATEFASTHLSDAQEFVYLAWFKYGTSRSLFNYEYLVTPDPDVEMQRQSQLAHRVLCEQIAIDLKERPDISEDPIFKVRFKKAIHFCKSSQLVEKQ